MLKHRLKHARALVVAISDPVASRKIVAITRQEAPKEDANDDGTAKDTPEDENTEPLDEQPAENELSFARFPF